MDLKVIKRKNSLHLRMLNKQDAEDVSQDVYVALLNAKTVVNYGNYYDAVIRNEKIQYIKKERALKIRESKACHETSHKENTSLSFKEEELPQFTNILCKELKVIVKSEFSKNCTEKVKKQSKVLEYILKEENEDQSADDIKKEVGFKTIDTAKSNLRCVRLKLKELKGILKNN